MSVEAAGARPENGRDRVTGLKGRLGRQLQEARRLSIRDQGSREVERKTGRTTGSGGPGRMQGK